MIRITPIVDSVWVLGYHVLWTVARIDCRKVESREMDSSQGRTYFTLRVEVHQLGWGHNTTTSMTVSGILKILSSTYLCTIPIYLVATTANSDFRLFI